MMKFILLLAVVLAVIWLVRSSRKPEPPSPRDAPPPPGEPDRLEDMVSCAHCGLHLPRSEALPGRGGVFCSEAHRRVYESQRSH